MIEPLLALPAHVRSRLQQALATAMLGPAVHHGRRPIRTRRRRRRRRGDPRRTCCARCQRRRRARDRARARRSRPSSGAVRPDLVWSGPTAPGMHTRDTRQVYEELIAAAQRSIWISTFAYFDGQHAFKSLADRMTASRAPGPAPAQHPASARRRHPGRRADGAVRGRFWRRTGRATREPDVYYDPRSLEPDGPEGVLHAKAIVADDGRRSSPPRT